MVCKEAADMAYKVMTEIFGNPSSLHTMGMESEKILEKMEQILPETTPGIPGTQLDTAMPVLQIQGKDYVAMIDVPAYGITLPVADTWDANRLHVTPSRYFGSAYNGTLVIGGSDHDRQFAFCSKIQHGAEIAVTDMTGETFTYTVGRIDRSKHADAQWLTAGELLWLLNGCSLWDVRGTEAIIQYGLPLLIRNNHILK